jgi:mannobiose 2-epimerase
MIQSKENIMPERLKDYRAEVEVELHRIMEFWKEHTPDEERGGFVGQMDPDGKVNKDSSKGSILNARILWTFSAAYKHTHKNAYFMLGRRAYQYLMKYFWDEKYGGIFWSLDAEGKPQNTRKQIYALAFALYGLSEYYQVSKEDQVLQACQELFRWIEQHSFDQQRGGYFEAFSREGKLLDDLRLSPKDRNDPKTMNTHLHILEAYTNLYRIWPDPQLAAQLEGLIHVFLDRIIDSRSGHMNLFFTADWSVTAGLVSYGHDIEASWLLLEAAEVLGKEKLVEKVKDKAIKMANAATEGLQPDGSLYHEYDKEANHYDKHREWWVSAEAMVGFLNAYQLTKENAYLEKSLNSWNFAKKHLLDQEKGEWYWGVLDDYSLMKNEDKVGFWKCPYHNARACMEVMQRCKALI